MRYRLVIMLKAKKLGEGTIRTHGGRKMQKKGGKWVSYSEGGKKKTRGKSKSNLDLKRRDELLHEIFFREKSGRAESEIREDIAKIDERIKERRTVLKARAAKKKSTLSDVGDKYTTDWQEVLAAAAEVGVVLAEGVSKYDIMDAAEEVGVIYEDEGDEEFYEGDEDRIGRGSLGPIKKSEMKKPSEVVELLQKGEHQRGVPDGTGPEGKGPTGKRQGFCKSDDEDDEDDDEEETERDEDFAREEKNEAAKDARE